ncbi:hypothetical protein VTL71DRAFT_395 [Oculimacula yallundae]|uniref:Uncharacterized protein n=1 Tax=Oculimacula yallundae TaxID=86028 RepID=A0ABR4D0V9_9HELO
MPPKSTKAQSQPQCAHPSLCTTSIPYAQEIGFIRPNLSQRLAAALPSGVLPSSSRPSKNSFGEADSAYPAPLVLPGSEISLYPNEKGQSLRAWLRDGGVNRVTEQRKTIYISLPPGYDSGVESMRGWTVPKGGDNKGGGRGETLDYELVASYVGVFYHGLPVKVLPEGEFAWLVDGDEMGDSDGLESGKKGKGKVQAKGIGKGKSKPKASTRPDFEEEPRVGLRSKASRKYTSIRSRPTPNYPYSNQLNLNDILDFAIASLPDDAFALLMLLEHDLYEEEEDEFVCGRAYGGSRVSVVSGARYWPGFDEEENVERVHGWPASHCEMHVEMLTNGGIVKSGNRNGREKGSIRDTAEVATKREEGNTPLLKALNVYSPPTSPKALTLLHIARLARTASHELGHCFGIAHCTYYACIMQGSSSLAEDARQPPYLCPVDEAKVLRATAKGVMSERRIEAWRRERLGVMSTFCKDVMERWGEGGGGSMFACLKAWIGGLLREEEEEGTGREAGERERVVIDLTMDD